MTNHHITLSTFQGDLYATETLGAALGFERVSVAAAVLWSGESPADVEIPFTIPNLELINP